jgi:pimeloyl-ACP methyl ester carboxylesterase
MLLDAPPAPVAITARCPAEARSLHARCGYVLVPLDRSSPGSPRIRIWFERYPRRDRARPATSTVVSIEGGPGYPTSADRASRVALWRPVARRRDLLLVDLRGTGRSTPLSCPAFARTSVPYAHRAGVCARQIGARRDDYVTAAAVTDLRDVIAALGSTRVDLYGDSYGSYAAQAFALRYPALLRSLVLDGTYPLPGTDPLWGDLLDAVRGGLVLSCRRSPTCPVGDPVALLGRVARQVRRHPLRGRAPNGDGVPTAVLLDETMLASVAAYGYASYGVWRELPAALLGAGRGDAAPLLRLAAESITSDAGPAHPAAYSEALYLSVICHDYPQPWDVTADLPARRSQLAAAIAARPAAAFAPFSAAAWTGQPYEGIDACIEWPAPTRADPPDPPGAAYPAVPTLVLNGDLDSITTLAQARAVAGRFPGSTFVDVHNSIHVTALGDTDRCASLLYGRFVRSLAVGDASCASRIGEQHVVAGFPRTVAAIVPAAPRAGNAGTADDRRLAAVAVRTVADVLDRWWVNYDGDGVGLRGGTWSYAGDPVVRFRLHGVVLVPGVRTSGTARWDRRSGAVHVDLRVVRGADVATMRASWALGRQRSSAWLAGHAGRRAIVARMPAP